jgi:hypothetical protein
MKPFTKANSELIGYNRSDNKKYDDIEFKYLISGIPNRDVKLFYLKNPELKK